MSTEALPVTDSIECLDFIPPCALSTVWPQYSSISEEKCQNPAEWVGIKSCCGMATYLCDIHLNDELNIDCGRCKKEWKNPRAMLSYVERL